MVSSIDETQVLEQLRKARKAATQINAAEPRAIEDLAQVEVTPSGSGLHWETLDTDLMVSGLLAGVFGTKTWMARLQKEWQQRAS